MFQAWQREKQLEKSFHFLFMTIIWQSWGKPLSKYYCLRWNPQIATAHLTEEQGWRRKWKRQTKHHLENPIPSLQFPIPIAHRTPGVWSQKTALLSLSILNPIRQAEAGFYINSYCKFKNLNKITLSSAASIDPWKTNLSSCRDPYLKILVQICKLSGLWQIWLSIGMLNFLLLIDTVVKNRIQSGLLAFLWCLVHKKPNERKIHVIYLSISI